MDQEVPGMGEGEMWEGEGCEVWKGRRERPHVHCDQFVFSAMSRGLTCLVESHELSSEIASFPYREIHTVC